MSLQTIRPGNHRAVATDSVQPKRSSGVPHHVTTSASQPPSGLRVIRYPTGSNKTQAKLMAARGSLSCIPTRERLGVDLVDISQVLMSAPSDGDIGTDHQTEASIDDTETYRVNAWHATRPYASCGWGERPRLCVRPFLATCLDLHTGSMTKADPTTTALTNRLVCSLRVRDITFTVSPGHREKGHGPRGVRGQDPPKDVRRNLRQHARRLQCWNL